jgi:hypothetical protein
LVNKRQNVEELKSRRRESFNKVIREVGEMKIGCEIGKKREIQKNAVHIFNTKKLK